jgi:hypothetical protein
MYYTWMYIGLLLLYSLYIVLPTINIEQITNTNGLIMWTLVQ